MFFLQRFVAPVAILAPGLFLSSREKTIVYLDGRNSGLSSSTYSTEASRYRNCGFKATRFNSFPIPSRIR